MINEFSISRDGRSKKLSPHFTLGEFACKGADVVKVNPELVAVLEQIRSWANDILPGCTVIVTSGFRTPQHNKEVGGAAASQHLLGNAADFKIRKPNGTFISPRTIYDALNYGTVTGKKFVGGLFLYPTWVHIDVRGRVAR